MNEIWIIICKHCRVKNVITVNAQNFNKYTECFCHSCSKEFKIDVKYLPDKNKYIPTGRGSFALVPVPEILN